ncbi:MAG: PilZ domain-containing protein [Terriglobia bacterium]
MGKEPRPPLARWQIPRKHPRVRLVTQVESRASGATSVGRTENISAGGMLVLTRDTFDPSTEVIVRFNLPPRHSIEAQGVVVHARPAASMGIHFAQLKHDDVKAIEEFVRQPCEEAPPPGSAAGT